MPFAVAAGIGAVGAIGGALISGSAAKSAAGEQAAAAEQASQNALYQYDQTKAQLQPFTNAGTAALGSLETALGLPGGTGPNPLMANGLPGLTFQPTQAQLAATPGYQFDLTQGLQAVQNSNAAQGRGISGAALKGAASYATGLANNTLTTQQGIFQNNLQNVINPLTGLVQTGENAGATVGAQGVQAVQNANALSVGGANASAAGTIGAANAASSALSGIGNSALNYSLYNSLLGGGGIGGGAQNFVDTGAFD